MSQPDYFAAVLQLKQPLQPDMNSADVKHAQILLKARLRPGRADGYFSKTMKKPFWRFKTGTSLIKQRSLIKDSGKMNQLMNEQKSDEKMIYSCKWR